MAGLNAKCLGQLSTDRETHWHFSHDQRLRRLVDCTCIATKWYWARDGKQFGPVGSGELRSLAGSGSLRPDDLVWKEGLAEWAEARKVSGLFPNDPPKFPPKVASPENVSFDSSLPPKFSPPATSDLHQAPAIVGNPSITGCCPKCGRSTWKCHLGCLPTLFIVLLFPIGLLHLLMPRRWECANCHYSYSSSDKPYGFTGSTTNV